MYEQLQKSLPDRLTLLSALLSCSAKDSVGFGCVVESVCADLEHDEHGCHAVDVDGGGLVQHVELSKVFALCNPLHTLRDSSDARKPLKPVSFVFYTTLPDKGWAHTSMLSPVS